MILTKLICSAHWQHNNSGCHEVVGFLMVTFSTNHAKRMKVVQIYLVSAILNHYKLCVTQHADLILQ